MPGNTSEVLHDAPLVSPNTILLKFLQSAQAEIGSVAEQNDMYTMQKIFEIVRDYIKARRLYDVKNPAVVYCADDPIGRVFGVNRFTVRDVLGLIYKNTIRGSPSTQVRVVDQSQEQQDKVSSTSESEVVRKRRIEVDVEASPFRKRLMFDEDIIIEHGSQHEQDSDVETVYSIQSKVTDVVKDSTDDLWFLEETSDEDDVDDNLFRHLSDNDVYANEYELVSEPDDAAGHSDSDDFAVSSHHEEIIIICESESDLEFFADCEDGDVESDELSDEDLNDGDKWTCSNCGTVNYPLRRYCDFCWTLRPDWLTSEKRDLSNRNLNNSAVSSQDSGFLSLQPDDDSPRRHVEQPSELDPPSVSADALIDRVNDAGNTPVTCTTTTSSAASNLPASNLCLICVSAPKDASIVHGSTGHQACCFRCARQLKNGRRPCPVCRRPIQRVIRNYYV